MTESHEPGKVESVRSIAILAAMSSELAPARRALGMDGAAADESGEIVGEYGGITVITRVTKMGLAAAQQATEALFARHGASIDHLFVVGIAGAHDPGLEVGDVLIPEVVIDERDGIARAPVNLSDRPARGVIFSTDRLRFDAEYFASLLRNKVSIVDMESGAIAAVCERYRCPVTIIRAVSDTIDQHGDALDVFHLANADGSPKYLAAIGYILRKPWKIPHLATMASGSRKAISASTAELLANLRNLLLRN